MEMEIKNEFEKVNVAQCRICLSVGRKLLPLGEYSNIYRKLTTGYEYQSPMCSEDVQICWECHALLCKAMQFQCRVQRANEMLRFGQSFITLSNLTTVVLNDTHTHTIYVNNQANIQTDETKTEEQVEYRDIVKIIPEDQYSDENDPATNEDNDNYEDLQNLQTIHIPADVKLETDVKTETLETMKSKKINKTNNRWAIKRALQNKKPKFRIVTSNNYRKIFKRVRVSVEELYRRLESERDSRYYKGSRYRCEKCILVFRSEDTLVKHNKSQHNKDLGPYICDICQTRMSKKSRLSVHVGRHYFMYECRLCEFTCHDRMRRRSHAAARHTKTFQCLKCELIFSCRRSFFKHFKEWHEKFICDQCGISFKMRYCIKEHIRKQHSPIECKLCSKRFSRSNGLWLHNKVRHPLPAAACPAYCVECDKSYPDVYRYRWHLANSAKHTPRKPVRVPCPACEKVFSKNIYMKDHYNLVHLKFIKYRCEECDKNFIRNADLVKHRRRVHEGILPPKNKICYVCGRGFSTNKILTNHVRTHTGERPYACAHCPARFAQSTALAGHARALHRAV